jgi:O-acetylhomoserine/O-acetylserine sulfhydrylase-like pyridoxal-dependent enzyme
MQNNNNNNFHDSTISTRCPRIIGRDQTIVPSIVTSTTYKLKDCNHGAELSKPEQHFDNELPFLYSRWLNPTNQAVAAHIAQLEQGYINCYNIIL